FKADPQHANEAPRWRSNPDGSLMMENRFADKTIAALKDGANSTRTTLNPPPDRLLWIMLP
ncbi:MAG: hypothetical protein KFF68_16455, partial [Desulfosarcina sp.]|nr:hypothetical protein [Desulfosarcina sp.]